MAEEFRSKSPEELGISNADYVALAEQLLLSRELVKALGPSSPLGQLHRRQMIYLETYFGLREPDPNNKDLWNLPY